MTYREANGFLFYLSAGTRLDIAIAVAKPPKFVGHRTMLHCSFVLRVFWYLINTQKFGSRYIEN